MLWMDKWARWAAAGVLGLAAMGAAVGNAQAADPVASASGGSGVPGGLAFVDVVFSFPDPFALAGANLYIDYDAAAMVFVPASSRVVVGAVEQNFQALIDALDTDAFGLGSAIVPDPGVPGQYSVLPSFLPGAGVPLPVLEGSLRLQAAFQLLSSAGGTVAVHGDLFAADFTAVPFDVSATVTAVPEPHTWAMLLGGVALIAGVAVRRRGWWQGA